MNLTCGIGAPQPTAAINSCFGALFVNRAAALVAGQGSSLWRRIL